MKVSQKKISYRRVLIKVVSFAVILMVVFIIILKFKTNIASRVVLITRLPPSKSSKFLTRMIMPSSSTSHSNQDTLLNTPEEDINRRIIAIIRHPRNIFISIEDKARGIARIPSGPQALLGFLHSPIGVFDSEQLLSRACENQINALNVLEAMTSIDDDELTRDFAFEGLEKLFSMAIPQDATLSEQRVMIATKKDALTALVRKNPIQGIKMFKQIEDTHQRQFMSHGVVLALIDLGFTLSEAGNYIAELPSD